MRRWCDQGSLSFHALFAGNPRRNAISVALELRSLFKLSFHELLHGGYHRHDYGTIYSDPLPSPIPRLSKQEGFLLTLSMSGRKIRKCIFIPPCPLREMGLGRLFANCPFWNGGCMNRIFGREFDLAESEGKKLSQEQVKNFREISFFPFFGTCSKSFSAGKPIFVLYTSSFLQL